MGNEMDFGPKLSSQVQNLVVLSVQSADLLGKETGCAGLKGRDNQVAFVCGLHQYLHLTSM